MLHALIGRLGSYKVQHARRRDRVRRRRSRPTQRRKRHLAEGLPHAPGVYIFRAADDRPLYVGTSVDIATRVRSYFTAAEKRARISEMLAAAERVEAVECAHALEAEVRELRLIAAHAPPYNRRSKFPERVVWLKLTDEAYPRLSVVRAAGPTPTTAYLGPFTLAQGGRAGRRRASTTRSRCASARCASRPAPRCPPARWPSWASARRPASTGSPPRSTTSGPPPRSGRRPPATRGSVVEALLARIAVLSDAHRYEEAAVVRGRLAAVLRAAVRMQRLAGAHRDRRAGRRPARRPPAAGSWRSSGRAGWPRPACRRRGVHPRGTIEVLRATAETVRPGHGPVPSASAEETERILSWLERPDTRLVETSAGWASPARGAARFGELLREGGGTGVDDKTRPNAQELTDRSDYACVT